MLGNLLQFPVTNDVRDVAGWAQLGADLTRQLSLSGRRRHVVSHRRPTGSGGRRTSESSVVGGMLRFKQGWFAFGPEYLSVIAKIIDKAGNGVPSGPARPTVPST